MKIILKIIQTINEIYTALMTLLIIILFKPLVSISEKILPAQKYQRLCFFLISIINNLFPLQKYQSLKDNQIEYNIRRYRDTYDREGLNLYLKYFGPNEIITGKEILDLGCGIGGKDLEFLKYNPKKIVGIDLSERNIRYAKELIDNANREKLFFKNIDLFDFKGKQKFDTVISYTVFEHIDKELLLPILNKIYGLLNNKGKAIIVFNHYNDKFGSHLKQYIYHPWPQTIFKEDIMSSYWNFKFSRDNNVNTESYFPPGYSHGKIKDNKECYMHLNKIPISEFEKIISKSKFNYHKKYFYSKSFLLKIFPFLPTKYLLGSVIYYLKK